MRVINEKCDGGSGGFMDKYILRENLGQPTYLESVDGKLRQWRESCNCKACLR